MAPIPDDARGGILLWDWRRELQHLRSRSKLNPEQNTGSIAGTVESNCARKSLSGEQASLNLPNGMGQGSGESRRSRWVGQPRAILGIRWPVPSFGREYDRQLFSSAWTTGSQELAKRRGKWWHKIADNGLASTHTVRRLPLLSAAYLGQEIGVCSSPPHHFTLCRCGRS